MTSEWNQGGSLNFEDDKEFYAGSFNDSIYYAFPPIGAICPWLKSFAIASGSTTNTAAHGSSLFDSNGSFTSNNLNTSNSVYAQGIRSDASAQYQNYGAPAAVKSFTFGQTGSHGFYTDYVRFVNRRIAGTTNATINVKFYYRDGTDQSSPADTSTATGSILSVHYNPAPSKLVWKAELIGWAGALDTYGELGSAFINLAFHDNSVNIESVVSDSEITLGGSFIFSQSIDYGISRTPYLPMAWTECNGQTVSDADSPYNGSIIPNLNGSAFTDQRFLLGSATLGSDGTGSHAHTITTGTPSATTNIVASAGTIPNTTHTHTSTTQYGYSYPSYYTTVYIMRIK